MSDKEEENVIVMDPNAEAETAESEAPETAGEGAEELTEEQIEALLEKEKEEREKSRIAHLKALATNHLGMRTALQNSVIMALNGSTNKVKARCTAYLNWAAAHYKANKIDCSEVMDEPGLAEMAERSRETIEQNRLVGFAGIQVAIQTAAIKGDGEINSLIEAFVNWNLAEEFADSFCKADD